MNQLQWTGLTAIGVMYAVFLVIGGLAARRARHASVDELLVADRRLPLWLAIFTMTATWVDGGYLLGTVEGVYRDGLAVAIQPGVCFGISLIVGGILFAPRMRRLEFTTLVDPFARRFGRRWGAVLSLPAMCGELFWSAQLLMALGSTVGVIFGMDLTTAVVASATVVTAYTMWGGIWSVAYTDAFQLGLIPVGMLAAVPFAWDAVGGWAAGWQEFLALRPEGWRLLPAVPADQTWTLTRTVGWCDLSLMLIFGGIPWNCYFQRVLSCPSPVKARYHSVAAGALTIVLTIPPALLGIAAVTHDWNAAQLDALSARPDMALPLMLRDVLPPAIGILGLMAIVGAVTSSFSSSILSAGSMISWNVVRGLAAPNITGPQLQRTVRVCIVLLGAASALMALRVQSVLQLWIFTSDLVYVLLFPQLLWALFDPRTNRIGSTAGFVASLLLRLGGGEPILGVPAFLPYHTLFGPWLPGGADAWFDAAAGQSLFPFRTLAATVGLVLIPCVSRLTRWQSPQPLEP